MSSAHEKQPSSSSKWRPKALIGRVRSGGNEVASSMDHRRGNMFRGRKSSSNIRGGMNDSPRVVATHVTGGMNCGPKQIHKSQNSSKEKKTDAAPSTKKEHFMNIDDSLQSESSSTRAMHCGVNYTTEQTVDNLSTNFPPEEVGLNTNKQQDESTPIFLDVAALPPGVDSMNMREMMLYKNELYRINQQQTFPSQIPPSYNRQKYKSELPRNDTPISGYSALGVVNGNEIIVTKEKSGNQSQSHTVDSAGRPTCRKDRENAPSSQPNSPVGVDEFDFNEGHEKRAQTKSKNPHKLKSRSIDEKWHGHYGNAREMDDGETTCGSRSMNNDISICESYFDDDLEAVEATLDQTTIGDSTWTSTDRDSSLFSCLDDEDGNLIEKQPEHRKSGSNPNSLLQQARSTKKCKLQKQQSSSSGNEDLDDYDSFADAALAACPFLPTCTDIQEEIAGTYKDASSALNQVMNAFFISEDDVDMMSDKIRDANWEIREKYWNQREEKKQTTPRRTKKVQKPSAPSGRIRRAV